MEGTSAELENDSLRKREVIEDEKDGMPTLSDVVPCDECGMPGDVVRMTCFSVLCGNPMCTLAHQCEQNPLGVCYHSHDCCVPEKGGYLPLDVEGGPTLQQSRLRLVVHSGSGHLVHSRDLTGINTVEKAVAEGLADPLTVMLPSG